jgi:large subunit ribosomal protein L22
MEAIAKLNNCPTTPRKMRLVVDQIRGEKVEKALYMLKYNQKPTYAQYVEKVLLSAIANYKEKYDGNEEDLFVKEVFVNQGRTLKRIKPAPQGRAHRIRKRSNHVTIVVSDGAEETAIETEE